MTTEGTGKLLHTVWKPRSTDEMQRLEQLARAAVGFDAARGDQAVIENVGFSSNTPELEATGFAKIMDQTDGLLQTQPGLLKTVSFSALGLLVVLLVLKPITRQMITVLNQAAPVELASGRTDAQLSAASAAFASSAFGRFDTPSLADLIAAKRPTDTQGIYEHVSEQIRREPVQSTRLLESWINAPEEEGE